MNFALSSENKIKYISESLRKSVVTNHILLLGLLLKLS